MSAFLRSIVNNRSSTSFTSVRNLTTYIVSGFPECPYFQRAKEAGQSAQAANPSNIKVQINASPRSAFHEYRKTTLKQLGLSEDAHTSCPLVTIAENGKPTKLVGGCDKFLAELGK